MDRHDFRLRMNTTSLLDGISKYLNIVVSITQHFIITVPFKKKHKLEGLITQEINDGQ